MRQKTRWRLFPDAESIAGEAARVVSDCAREALRKRPSFHLVLAGGSTPTKLYRLLQESQPDLSGWHVYFGDERCLPKGDPARNDTLAASAWPRLSELPSKHYFPIPAERGPEEAAKAYAGVLDRIELFDLVLLGVGEDGHTASLFPGFPIGTAPASPAVLPVRNAPKPPPERVTLSAWRLSRTRRVLFLVAGAAKRNAVVRWAAGDDLPVGHIRPGARIEVFLDRMAAPPDWT